jgi:hypothetical protein
MANDPNIGKISIATLRNDGFINVKLRVLTIAAYLRVLLATIEYAPSIDL